MDTFQDWLHDPLVQTFLALLPSDRRDLAISALRIAYGAGRIEGFQEGAALGQRAMARLGGDLRGKPLS